MSETLWQDSNKNNIILHENILYSAYGDDPIANSVILFFLHLLAFPFILTFFQFLFKKNPFLVNIQSFPVSFFLSVLITVALFLLFRRVIIHNRLATAIDRRSNFFSIDLKSRAVIRKERYKEVERFVLSSDDYFYFPRKSQSEFIHTHKYGGSYSLYFVHGKNLTLSVAHSISSEPLEKLLTKLGEMNVPIKKDY